MQQPAFVTVGWAYGQAEAALAAALLNSAGIQVMRDTWFTSTVYWHLHHALGGIELRVPAAQAVDAVVLLAEHPIARRPRSWQQRLFTGAALAMVAAFLLVSIPPPPSGFFAAAPRPNPSRPTVSRATAP